MPGSPFHLAAALSQNRDALPSGRSVSGRGEAVARRRYQKGQLLLLGSKEKRWFGRWYEDVLESGSVRRVRRQEFIGTQKDYPTRKLAIRELDKRLTVVNNPAYRARPTASFAEFAVRWEATVVPQLKASTAINYRSHLRCHLNPFFGAYRLADITPEMVQRFVSNLKVNPLTIHHIFVTLQSLWRSARAWRYVADDVTEGVRLPRRIPAERRHFSIEEMSSIIATAAEPYRTCFWLAAETGMRAGELCGLRWQDVDLEQRLVSVVQTAWQGRIQTPKNAASVRRFSLSAKLIAYLRSRLPSWTPNPYGLIFATRNGTAWQCRKPLRQLQSVLKQLQLPNAGLHAFRHSQITVAERAGVPLKTIQSRVGHSSHETTLLYSHAVGEDDRKFSGWLGEQLNPMCVQNSGVSDANGRELLVASPQVIESVG